MKRTVVIVAIALSFIVSASSTMAQTIVAPSNPAAGSSCLVYSPGGHAEVYSAPSVFAPVINYLINGDYYQSEGTVTGGGQTFYMIWKHDEGGEFTIGVGYVLASDLVVPNRCGAAPVQQQPATDFSSNP